MLQPCRRPDDGLFERQDSLLLAKYKHFTFADTIRSERDDHGSIELWNIWRSIALRKLSLTDSILDMLSSMEKDALTKLDTVRKNTQNQKKSLSFAEAIHEEIDLLQKDV